MDAIGFALDFMKKQKMPADAIACMKEGFEKLCEEETALSEFERMKERFLKKKQSYALRKAAIASLSKKLGICRQEVDFLFLLYCLADTKREYENRGLSDDLFYHTFADLKYKLLECKNVRNVWGTFVPAWYGRFFWLERFAFGRFQFELADFPFLRYDGYGVRLRYHTTVINFHIPSDGESISIKNRLESFQQAYAFFRSYCQNDKLVFVCFSWLLYRDHFTFLPEGSNIVDFMKDFDIIHSIPSPVFLDKWRIYGQKATWKTESLPEETTLQRLYKDRLLKGGHSGFGYGILIFDGENIVTR